MVGVAAQIEVRVLREIDDSGLVRRRRVVDPQRVLALAIRSREASDDAAVSGNRGLHAIAIAQRVELDASYLTATGSARVVGSWEPLACRPAYGPG